MLSLGADKRKKEIEEMEIMQREDPSSMMAGQSPGQDRAETQIRQDDLFVERMDTERGNVHKIGTIRLKRMKLQTL